MNEDASKPQTAVDYVLEHSKHTRNTGYVLIKLARCIDQGNTCPSHNELATLTGLSKMTIQRVLGELEKEGWITSTKHGGDTKNGGKKNCYTLPGMNPVSPCDPDNNEVPRIQSIPDTKLPGNTDDTRIQSPAQTDEPHAPVHVDGDAATRVEDLSLRAKDLTAKEPPVIPQTAGQAATAAPEPIASDDAQVLPSKPKRERKPPIPKDDTYHRLLRGVALRSWAIDPENAAMKDMLGDDDFGRIGKIVSWLRGINTTPEILADFYTWYRQQYSNAAAPKDLVKFREHYAAFVQSKTQPVSLPSSPALVPVRERRRLDPSELPSSEAIAADKFGSNHR